MNNNMTREQYREEIAEIHKLMKEWVRKAADPSIDRSKLSELLINHDLIEKNYEKTLFSPELWDELYGVLSLKDELKSKVAIEVMNARYFFNVIFHPVCNNLRKALELLNEAADFIEKNFKEDVKNTKPQEAKASYHQSLVKLKKNFAEKRAEENDGWNVMDACSNHGHWLD